jgi:hypothetical protein
MWHGHAYIDAYLFMACKYLLGYDKISFYPKYLLGYDKIPLYPKYPLGYDKISLYPKCTVNVKYHSLIVVHIK